MGTIVTDVEAGATLAELLVPARGVVAHKKAATAALQICTSSRALQPGAEAEDAQRWSGEARASSNCGCFTDRRPAQHAQRRQVHADRGDLNARTEIADYPFHHVAPPPRRRARRAGVELRRRRRSGSDRGAAEGAGAGASVPASPLQRTQLLLHVIDIAPFDGPWIRWRRRAHRGRAEEVRRPTPCAKPRWLVLNKIDMVPADRACPAACTSSCASCAGRDGVRVSALTRQELRHPGARGLRTSRTRRPAAVLADTLRRPATVPDHGWGSSPARGVVVKGQFEPRHRRSRGLDAAAIGDWCPAARRARQPGPAKW